MNIKRHFNSGFTIVELIIVVVIIGILAGIVIVGYGNWQDSVAKKSVQSDLKMAAVAMESAKNFGSGYPTALPSTFQSSPKVTVVYYSGNSTDFCIDGTYVSRPSVHYYIDTTKGKDPRLGTCVAGDEQVAPAAPLVAASATSSSSITVTWSAVSGATSYTVKYGTATPTTTASCSSSPCTLSGLSSSTLYYIGVTASNTYGTSPQGTAQATTQSSGGGLQGGPLFAGSGTASFSSSTSLSLSWPSYTWSGSGYSSCPAGSSIKYLYGYQTSGGSTNYSYGTGTGASYTLSNPDSDTNNSVSYSSVAVFCADSSNNKTSNGALMQAYPCNTSYCRTNSIGYPSISIQ